MIRYPQLTGRHVGVTAPSSGVPAARHSLLHDAETTFARHGFTLQFEPSVWTQHKAKSARPSRSISTSRSHPPSSSSPDSLC
ncbi:hypothetical protein EVJ27_03915 [Exiguobacterium sp. SH3S2]|uniref:hypothetical protein n=1 Tax=unclassified Exiguobacterium TaxID=2644629 RepID=UPI00103DE67B|nr:MULTISPECIES: hypothetical protein [unclassified Exiguobacterium]TCI25786.1 hypothetical protein EVJ32_08790 [Exiguobacterium sp. SH5S4]TCI47281.1 hypothetical protein EVJ28_03910 [Exiguobacterium sp. SH3S3]TCI62428.1 hypothetical protein EVJ27_03915 [Exiguobacterium sp. SH3S2]